MVKTMASAQKNRNSLFFRFSPPGNCDLNSKAACSPWAIMFSTLTEDAFSAYEQQSPLRWLERQICSSKSCRSQIASMTALEAIDAMTRCGYLYRNQADSAPGYEPPTDIQGLLVIPNISLSFTTWIKQARSLRACSEFSSAIFCRLKESLPKGSDSPQNLCYKAITIPCSRWVYVRIQVRVYGTPSQVHSPQIYRKMGPIAGLKYSLQTQYLWFQKVAVLQSQWSSTWLNTCYVDLSLSLGVALLKRRSYLGLSLARAAEMSKVKRINFSMLIDLQQDQLLQITHGSLGLKIGISSIETGMADISD